MLRKAYVRKHVAFSFFVNCGCGSYTFLKTSHYVTMTSLCFSMKYGYNLSLWSLLPVIGSGGVTSSSSFSISTSKGSC